MKRIVVCYHSARQMTVAIVEDERGVREAVTFALEKENYRVSAYSDGRQAASSFEEQLPDIAILDILLPHVDGLELCKLLRRQSDEIPVIFLTSKDDEFDRVLGLELGADDYLCKPFSMRELVARVRALGRRLELLRSRTTARPEEHVSVGALALDSGALRVGWHGEAIPLTVTEFRILEALVRRPSVVLSREQLLAAAYPHDVYVTERSVDSHIRRIRKKFEDAGAPIDGIESVYGAGYRFLAGA